MNTNRLRLISIALVVCMFADATHLAMRGTIAAEPPEKPTFKEYLKKSHHGSCQSTRREPYLHPAFVKSGSSLSQGLFVKAHP